MIQRPIMGPTGMRQGALAVLAVYVGLYAWLLLKTAFQPYVMDNNESWSVLWHARNLIEFGLNSSFGLADEVFSPDPAAHPFAHTHQGNFPRLFGALLYLLGARSVEAQIAIATFTVGAAGIWFAYRFLAGLGGALFGTVAALLLMSDYLLFAQWQVNTYRVWQGFLFFGALLAIKKCTEKQNARWLFMVGLVHAALFYGEIVFAVFVAALGGLYALVLRRGDLRHVAGVWLVQTAGAAAAAGILVTQLVAYYGWEGLIQDMRLTLHSRSFADNTEATRSVLEGFYDRYNVAFWYNVVDASSLVSFRAFVGSFFKYDLQTFTPLLVLISGALLLGWMLGHLAQRSNLPNWSRDLRAVLPSPILLLAPAWYLFLIAIVNDGSTLLAAETPSLLLIHPSWKVTATAVAASLFVSSILAGIVVRRRGLEDARDDSRFSFVMLYLALLVLVVRLHRALYDEGLAPILDQIVSGMGHPAVAYAGVGVAAFAGALLIVVGPAATLAPRQTTGMRQVSVFVACGLVCYAAVYVLFPGYIYSGYLARSVPFTVFLTIPSLAMVLWLALELCIGAIRALRSRPSREIETTSGDRRSSRLQWVAIASTAGGAAVFMVAYWGHVQLSYVRLFPPDHFAFLKSLEHEPFRGRTAVVNNYGAPVAAATGNWAYYDPLIESGRVRLTPRGYERQRDARTYLWFADRKSNRDYLKPDLYVCMMPQSREMVATALKSRSIDGGAGIGCESKGLVRNARGEGDDIARAQLLAFDDEGMRRRGFASWAVVALDHDFPPFLIPVASGVPSAPDVGLTLDGRAPNQQVAIQYRYADQENRPPGAAKVQLILRSPDRSCGVAGSEQVLAEGRNLKRVPIPKGFHGAVQALVTPASATKLGQTFESAVLWISGSVTEAISCPPLHDKSGRRLGLQVTRDSPTVAALTWSGDLFAKTYGIRMRRGCGSWENIGEFPAGVTSFRVGGLNAPDAYAFEVQACSGGKCIQKRASAAGAGQVTLDCPVPKRPEGVSAIRSNMAEIDLGWPLPRRGAQYRIEMQRGCNAMVDIVQLDGDLGRFRIHEVPSDTFYRFRVRECVGDDCSDYARDIEVPDLAGRIGICPPPGIPEGVQISREVPSELRLKWSTTARDVTYRIEMAKNCEPFRDMGYIAANRGGYRIADVNPLAVYRVRLKECVGAECSSYTPVLVATGSDKRNLVCHEGDDTAEVWSRQWGS